MMFFATFCALLFCFSLTSAQQLPACAVQCLLESLEGQSDWMHNTDIASLCKSAASDDTIYDCVLSSCTPKEIMAAKNTTQVTCGEPVRDISHITPLVIGISGGLAIIAVIVRCSTSDTLSLDNIFAVVALVSALPMGILGLSMPGDGFGRDIWTLPPDNVTRIIKVLWIGEISYVLAVAFTKLSFLFFCLRIFPREGFRTRIYILIGVVVAYGTAFTFACIFNCTPVSYIWTNWDGEHTGTCINFHVFAWAHATINISLDMVLVIVPIPELLALSLNLKKKIFIIVMFSMGAFTTVVSIIRLHSLVQFANSMNPTYDNVPTAYWSVLEAYFGIFCISMPYIRRFLARTFPMCFSSNGYGSNRQPYNTPATPHRSSNGKAKSTKSNVGLNTMLRGSAIMKTIDTVVENELQDDEVQLVDMEAQRMEKLNAEWAVEREENASSTKKEKKRSKLLQETSSHHDDPRKA